MVHISQCIHIANHLVGPVSIYSFTLLIISQSWGDGENDRDFCLVQLDSWYYPEEPITVPEV